MGGDPAHATSSPNDFTMRLLTTLVALATLGTALSPHRATAQATTRDSLPAVRLLVTAFLQADTLGRRAADSVGLHLRAEQPAWLVWQRRDAVQYVADYVYGPANGPMPPNDLRELAKIFRTCVLFDVHAEREPGGVRLAAVAIVRARGQDSTTVTTVRAADVGTAARGLAVALAGDVRARAEQESCTRP